MTKMVDSEVLSDLLRNDGLQRNSGEAGQNGVRTIRISAHRSIRDRVSACNPGTFHERISPQYGPEGMTPRLATFRARP